MKKGFLKRFAAVGLSAAMLVTALPQNIKAEENSQTADTILSLEEENVDGQENESATNDEDSQETTEAEASSSAEEQQKEDTVVDLDDDGSALSYFSQIGNDTDTDTVTVTEDATEDILAVTSDTQVSVESPVIKGKEVTFNYYTDDATVTRVRLAGEMTGWKDGAKDLEKDEKTNIWSITLTLDKESYEYKFILNDDNWIKDPANSKEKNNNSLVELPDNKVTEYTYTIYYRSEVDDETYDIDNTALWIWTDGVNGQEYTFTEKETLTDGNTWLKSEQNFSYDMLYFIPKSISNWEWQTDTLNYVNSLKKDVTLYIVKGSDKKSAKLYYALPDSDTYQYTIYYKGEKDGKALTKDDCAAWVWHKDVNGSLYYFGKEEELEDGDTWLKTVVATDKDNLSIIVRKYDSWEWQDVQVDYTNTDKAKEVTLYLVKGDTTAYTELPNSNDPTAQRKVLIEYHRANNDYNTDAGKWNIYTWNSGYGSDVTVDCEEKDGFAVATVPVTKKTSSISFCMRRTTEDNPWAEKDGGDHAVNIPLDQQVVKAIFEEGKGITEVLPMNIGYEIDSINKKVYFYYRDDELFAAYNQESLEGKVSVVFDGTTYDMTYDADNERYQAEVELTEGNHYYKYVVDGEKKLDAFNDQKVTIDGEEYSAFIFKVLPVTIEVSLSEEQIDYGMNSVLSVKTIADEQTLEEFQVASITADLSELGGSEEFAIDPELMEGTIAVKEDVSTGTKTIPVTLKDQLGNVYTTEVEIKVVPRTNDDFDWEEAVIYFAVTDRFYDGNQDNDDFEGYDPEKGSMYHGGDFKGLTEKLDYLKELGVNTVWITPIVSNSDVVEPGDGKGQTNAAYHGYWADDFTKLNSHLGTEEEFSELLNELHKRGMKLMVDVVINHAGYHTEDYFNSILPNGKKMLRDSETTVAGDDQKDSLSNLPDFVTEDAEVRDLLVEWQTSWISKYDIDYYRVDTVKHVEGTTWKAFKNALTKENPEFKMIGEYSGAGYATDAGQLRTGQMDALLDFDFNDNALKFVGGNIGDVEKFLENRNSSIDNTATMGSFVGSHDEDGLMYRMMQSTNNEGLGFDEDKAYALMKVAATLQITAKGQPIVYYGEELGQTGANNWPYQENRYDFDWEHANDDNDMLVHYKKLLAIRNENTKVFAKGNRNTVKLDDENNYLVVSRTYGNDTLFIGMNTNQNDAIETDINVSDGKYIDLYSGDIYEAVNGKMTITIPAAADGGTIILKAKTDAGNKDDNKQDDQTQNNQSQSSTGAVVTGSRSSSSKKTSSKISAVIKAIVSVPSITKADGTVVKGWNAVVNDAITQTLLNDERVALASDPNSVVDSKVNTATIDLTLCVNKVIPQETVDIMKASDMNFIVKINKDVEITLTREMLATITNQGLDLSLGVVSKVLEDFASYHIHPTKALAGNVALTLNVGIAQVGKQVFVYNKNITNNVIEFTGYETIDENGKVTLHGNAITDYVVLY